MSDGLNWEIWTTPNSASFKRVADITPWILPGSNMDLRLVDLSSGVMRVHKDCPYLSSIHAVDKADHTNDVGSTVMLFDGGTWVAAMVPTRRNVTPSSETQPWHEYQLEGLEWYFDRARVKAFDYAADPIREGDWLYGAPTILTKAGGEISDAQWFLWVTGATSGTFTITDGTDTTLAINWNETDPAVIATRLETDITAIVDVAVSGTGTAANRFLIILADPAETDLTLTVNDTTDGTVIIDQTRVGGTPSPRPWHGSMDGNTGVLIGNYDQFDMVAVSTGGAPAAPAGSASTYLLRLDAFTPDSAGDYAGAQREAAVVSGHRHRALINVWSDTAQTIRLVIRNLTEGLLAYDEQTVTAATWTLMSIPTFTPNVETVVYRVGVIEEGDAGVIYLDVDEAVLAPGEAEANLGEIVTALRSPMDTRNVLDWVDETWDATNDSSATAWDRDLSVAVRHGQSMMHWLEYAARWGYERSIRYDSGNPAATPFDYNLYNSGGRDSNPTGVSVSAIDGMTAASPVEEAAPDFTTAIAEGDQGRWGEYSDANLATGWGKLEGYFANKQGRDSTDLDVLAQQMVSDSAAETVSHAVTVQNPSKLFGIDLLIGDTIPVAVHAADGTITPTDFRLVGCVITETDTLPTYKYSFGAVVFDSEAAQADALRSLIRRFNALDESGSTGTADPVAFGVRGATSAPSAGSYVHLSRNATQSIGVGGEEISWDTIGLEGYSGFAPTVPTTSIPVRQAGYYDIGIQLGWSSFTGGGTVTVLRNGVTVWPPADDPGLWSTTDGQLFEGTAHAIPCKPSDVLSVNVDADDVSAQTLASATLTVYLVDRAALEGPYRELVLSHGPLAYWRLDETSGTNAADSAGHTSGPFDGTYTNTPTLDQLGVMKDGSGSPSVDFNGTKHVLGADWAAMDFVSGSFSVEAWFNADALSGTTSLIIGKRINSGAGWHLGVITTKVFFATDSTTIVASGSVSTGTDYHAVVTFDGTTHRMYLNGVLVDTDTGKTIAGNNEVVSIARHIASGSPGFQMDGTIDEVAVYDRALTAAEVQEHYRVGS